MKPKVNYAELLRRRAEDHRDEVAASAPISLREYRARRDRQRWLERLAAVASGKILS